MTVKPAPVANQPEGRPIKWTFNYTCICCESVLWKRKSSQSTFSWETNASALDQSNTADSSNSGTGCRWQWGRSIQLNSMFTSDYMCASAGRPHSWGRHNQRGRRYFRRATRSPDVSGGGCSAARYNTTNFTEHLQRHHTEEFEKYLFSKSISLSTETPKTQGWVLGAEEVHP